jgi:hypothetical protein
VVEINLTTGAYRNTYTNASGRYTDFSYNVTTSADGWHRAEMSATTASALNFQMRVYPSNVAWTSGSFGSEYPAGNGTSGIYLWGFQIEQSPTANEYHANLGVSVKYRGTVWTDLSGQENTGTLDADVSYSSDNKGIMLFGPLNTVGEVRFSRNDFIFGSGDFSVTVWANPSAIETHDTLYEMGYYTDGILFRPTSDSIQVYMGNSLSGGGNRTYTHARSIGRWDHYTLIRQSGIVKLYNNAVQNGTDWANTASLTLAAAATCKIGSSTHTTSQRWNGYVNNFKIYNRALTAAEIAQNFNALRGRYGI